MPQQQQQKPFADIVAVLSWFRLVIQGFGTQVTNLLRIPFTQGYGCHWPTELAAIFLPLVVIEMRGQQPGDGYVFAYVWLLWLAFMIQRSSALLARLFGVARHTGNIGTSWFEFFFGGRFSCQVLDSLLVAGVGWLVADISSNLAVTLWWAATCNFVSVQMIYARIARQADASLDAVYEGRYVADGLRRRMGG